MACGLPVVAASATGAASLVVQNETGQLVPPGKDTHETATRFAEAIAPYCTDAALRSAHGEAGEKRSLEFSWEAINQGVEIGRASGRGRG